MEEMVVKSLDQIWN